jgi:FlaA1/EpsC-like NDP-sugar epimerase
MNVENFIYNKNHNQVTLYNVTAMAYLLFIIATQVGIRQTNKTFHTTDKIVRIIAGLVFIVLIYHLVKYLAEHNHPTAAWIVASIPIINFILLGFGTGFMLGKTISNQFQIKQFKF